MADNADSAMLQSQFLDHTASATQTDFDEYISNESNADHGFMTNVNVVRGLSSGGGRARAATALPGNYAREIERVSNVVVPTAEAGDLRDPVVSNLPIEGQQQRHVTTNEPPLPEVPSNMRRNRIGVSGVVEDRTRDTNKLLTHADVDVHRALNSFHPQGMRLREYDWNEGGALGVHQGLGLRFDSQSKFNRYGRQLTPGQVSKKEPIPMAYDPRQERAAPYTSQVAFAERNVSAARVRDRRDADFLSMDTASLRGQVKTGGVFLPPTRPDMLVHPSRRDNPEPRVQRLEAPYVARSRAHALVAQEQSLESYRQLLADGF